MNILSDNIKNKIKLHAKNELPNEACGVIIKSGEFIDIYQCKNISSNKKEQFELNPFDYLKASNKGKVIGIYHTQEYINPSILDYVISSGHNIYSVVYSWKHDSFVEINDRIIKYAKYTGRPFELGVSDCYSLLCDFYKTEYGLILGHYDRNDDWFKKNPNIIEDSYLKENFEKIDFNNLKIGDLIIFGLAKASVHIGIYLGNNMFLHHPRDKYSTVELITNSFQNKIRFCLRHNNKVNNW